MVRVLIPLGWFGVVILVYASYSGYGVEPGSNQVGNHILSALLSAAPLLMVYLCLLIYLVGTRRLVRDSSSRGGDLENRYRSTTTGSLAACTIGAVPLVLLFASGLPTHTGKVEPLLHSVLSYVALLCQLIALTWLGRSVGRGERLLGEVAAAEYNGGASEPSSG